MKRFAFVSRHEPTEDQVQLCLDLGIEMVPVGDRDGFRCDPNEFRAFDGVIVAHAAAALRYATLGDMDVAVFENVGRADGGFRPLRLVVYRTVEGHAYLPGRGPETYHNVVQRGQFCGYSDNGIEQWLVDGEILDSYEVRKRGLKFWSDNP